MSFKILTLSESLLNKRQNNIGDFLMGMAASQARYLALTARKTNTEYEGQQINQARTALANQSANLFNRLLNMEVPNPPKTTDYTEIQYSYSDGENESVLDEWHQLSNKNPDYNYVVKHYYMADLYTGAKKMLNDPQIQIDDVLKNMKYPDNATVTFDASGNITVTYPVGSNTESNTYSKINQAQVDSDPKLSSSLRSFEVAKGLATSAGVLNTDDVHGYQDSDGVWHFLVANEYNQLTNAQVSADAALKQALQDAGYLDSSDHLIGNIFGYRSSNGTWKFSVEAASQTTPVYKTVDNTDYSVANGPSYIGNSRLTELNELVVDDSVDQVAELAQILKDCPDSSISKYLSLDASGNLLYSGEGIYSFDLYGKTYYTTEEDLQGSAGYPYDRNKPIDAQQKLAYYNASYVPTKIEQTNNALLETDGNGRFKSVKFDNDSVVYTLNTETVTNEAAYQDAMNQYLYKKAQYEKTIADINAKTSIIQKEDRTLELRLKQLDTEQNALKTEMDAVKKVIKDNVDTTFKTFSD